MKFILILLFFNFISSVSQCQCNSLVINSLIENEKIKTVEFQKLSSFDTEGYAEYLIPTGDIAVVSNIYGLVVEGIKNETIFQILLIIKNCKITFVQEIPKATFYWKNGSLKEEFQLGRTYTGYTINGACVEGIFEVLEPYRTDTMTNKFSYLKSKVVLTKTADFCPSE